MLEQVRCVCTRGAPFRIGDLGCRIWDFAYSAQRKRPPNVCSAAFVSPGGYLLSRDLSSDYHRRADVSLPGSEWDRVGPSGCDHQVSALLRLRCAACLGVIAGLGCVMCGSFLEGEDWHPHGHGIYDLQFTIYNF